MGVQYVWHMLNTQKRCIWGWIETIFGALIPFGAWSWDGFDYVGDDVWD